MPLPLFLPIILAAMATTGTIGSVVMAEKASDEANKATQARNRINERRAQREKIDQLRKARIAAGVAANTGANQGTGQSSTTQGAVSSIMSQYASNVNLIDQSMTDARTAAYYDTKSSSSSSLGSTLGAVGNLSFQTFDLINGTAQIKDYFSKKGQTNG